MTKPSSFVTKVDVALADKMKQDLTEQGFQLTRPAHTLFSAKKTGVSCTLYQSGKLLVQGKDMGTFIEFYLEPQILKDFSYTHQETLVDTTPRIGCDEAGKGDFFGHLTAAAVYADQGGIQELIKMGVKDSKSMNDTTILSLGRKIEKNFPCHIVAIGPEKYNEIYPKFGNLNQLLAWAHASCIEQLVAKTHCREVIIDQFAYESVMENAVRRKKLELQMTQRTKGEGDVVVAAASIVARKNFVEKLEALERKYEVSLPKGGSSPKVIRAGKHFIAKYGVEKLGLVGKLHFKTKDSIILP